jgi:hypothetical protein
MWHKLRWYAQSERGSALITYTVLLVVMLGFLSMVLDGGYAFAQHLRIQNAADAAAEAGFRMYAVGGTSTQIDNEIQTYAGANGADSVQWQWVTTPADPCASTDCLQVSASRTFSTFFGGIVGIDTLTVAAGSIIYGTGVAQHDNLWPIAFQWEGYVLGEEEWWNTPERHFDVDSFGEDSGGHHGHGGDGGDKGHGESGHGGHDGGGSFKRLYHKHQFDRTYGNEIDIMGFADFKWAQAMQNVYANNHRISIRFKHVCNAAGSFDIKFNGMDSITGVWPGAAGELEWVVQNKYISDLEHIYLVPFNLNLLRGTQPGPVKDDPIERDYAYTMQIYDVDDNNKLVWEFSIYEHVDKGAERCQCRGIEGPPLTGHSWTWIDFDGGTSSDQELADAICNPDTSPLLSIDDTVTQIAGVSNTQAVRDCLDQWLNQEVYVPIYDTIIGEGPDAQAHIVGFAVFILDSYDLTGDAGYIHGHFIGSIESGPGGGGPNYGLQILKFAQ